MERGNHIDDLEERNPNNDRASSFEQLDRNLQEGGKTENDRG